ncbi:MAG: hypothetical protein V9F01_03950 [Chitinophagaceae bacterium]
MADSVAVALKNWVPYKLSINDNEALARWLFLGDIKIDRPFFTDTISECQKLPYNSKFLKGLSSVDLMPEWATHLQSVTPSAFIFHISRCGSTLLSQLLALDEQHIVLSEVPFFDQLLRMQYQIPDTSLTSINEYLKSAISFYGQKRNGIEKHLFIKADSWHIFFYERLRQLYPTVPFILLYRSPDEVLQSQQKRRGMQAVPGVVEFELMGIQEGEDNIINLDLYFSKVMEKILVKFTEVAEKDPLSLLVNYDEGMIPIIKRIAVFSGIELTDELTNKMEIRNQYHGKYPEQVFSAEEKMKVMPPFLSESMRLYTQLEKKRKENLSL